MLRLSVLCGLLGLLGLGCNGDDVALDGLIINEIGPVDGDYIELMNIGADPIAIGGYQLADTQGGGPRPDERVVFEEGATIAPGERLLIQANLGTDALPGERTECGPGAPPRCYYASWGISNANGESIYVLAPNDTVVLEYAYPMMAITEGAWGRVPDGTGEFANTMRSPGQENQPRP